MTKETLIGQTIGGCEILSEIGHGGMGVVYRARQISLDRTVAVKVLSPRYADDPVFVERLRREARAVAKVNHPNICAVYDVGDHDQIHFMVMEYVEGMTLSQILESRGLLPFAEAADIILQAARGLDRAASTGIIHRDIKPDNLLLTRDGQVKITDFGLARDSSTRLTATDAVMGTPAYMSPEQCDGQTLDPRSDQYSLGATFYRAVTGRLPFEADTAMAMMYRHKHEPLVPANRVVPEVPEAYARVIGRMMEKKPENRLQSFGELVETMENAARGGSGAPKSERRRRQTRSFAFSEDGETKAETAVDSPPGELDSAVWRPPTAQDSSSSSHRMVRDESERRREAERLRTAARQMVEDGEIQDAARTYGHILRLVSGDKEAQERKKYLDERLKERNRVITDIRQLILQRRIDEAVAAWDELPSDLRDSSLTEQIEHFRGATIPAARLIDEAEQMVQDGQLEEAVRHYELVLGFDPTNAQAKQGVTDTRMRIGRAATMLGEAIVLKDKGDYPAALAKLIGLLDIVPNHPKARQQLLDTRYRHGLKIRTEANGPVRAIEQWKQILRLYPGHEEVRQYLDEDTERAQQLQEHLEQANQARRRGRNTAAIRHWRGALEIDPKNERAHQSLTAARGRRTKTVVLYTLVILFLLVTGVVGYVFVREMLFIHQLKQMRAANDVQGAYVLVKEFEEERKAYLLAGHIAELARETRHRKHWADGIMAAQEKRWADAIQAYDQALSHGGAREGDMPIRIARAQAILSDGMKKVEEFESPKAWEVWKAHAREAYQLVLRLNFELKDFMELLGPEADQLRWRANFYLLLDDATLKESEGNWEEAERAYARCRPHAGTPDLEMLVAVGEFQAKYARKMAEVRELDNIKNWKLEVYVASRKIDLLLTLTTKLAPVAIADKLDKLKDRKAFYKLVREAVEEENAGRMGKAIALYRRARTLLPEHPLARDPALNN